MSGGLGTSIPPGGGFGNPLSSGMGAATGGNQPPYAPTMMTLGKEAASADQRLMSITAMPAYANQSFEELRASGVVPGSGGAGTTSGFGVATNSAFGNAPTGTTAFGGAGVTSSAFGQTVGGGMSRPFGQPTPAAVSQPFGATNGV